MAWQKHYAVTKMDPVISDDKVLSMANESKAILLTADRDFGDLVFRQGRITEGVVLIRLSGFLDRFLLAIVCHDGLGSDGRISPSGKQINLPLRTPCLDRSPAERDASTGSEIILLAIIFPDFFYASVQAIPL